MKGLYFCCAGILLLIFALSYGALALSDRTDGHVIVPQPVSQSSEFRIRSNTFIREDEEDRSQVTYQWWDHGDDSYSIVFSLAGDVIRQSEEEFGYFPVEMDAYVEERLMPSRVRMIRELRAFVLNQMSKSRYGYYFYIEDKDSLSFQLKMIAPATAAKEHEKIKAEFKKIVNRLTKKQARYIKDIQSEDLKFKRQYLESRGLRLEGTNLFVDYTWVIRNNRDRLTPAIESLSRVARGKSVREFLSILLAFVQSMGYGIPPDVEGDKVILGFWPPPKVLVNNYGDCDSKGAVFASLWTYFRRYPLLLIRIPEHMFLGIAIPSYRGPQFTFNGLRYTLCEVTGPELVPPGFLSGYSRLHLERGGFHYEMVR
jgi:hypothetical protein